MANLQAHFAPTWNHHHAPTTTAGKEVAFNAHGSCVRHPDILLRKKKSFGFGWKVLLHECPRCKIDWEEERRFKHQQQQQQQQQQVHVAKPPHKPARKPLVQEVTEEPSEDDEEEEEEIVYTPPPHKQKPARKPAPRPPTPEPEEEEEQTSSYRPPCVRPPPVQPLVEACVPMDMQIAAVTGHIGNLVNLMRQYLGSAKLAGMGCEFCGNCPIFHPILSF